MRGTFLSRVVCQILSRPTAELNEGNHLIDTKTFSQCFASDLVSTERFLNPTTSFWLKTSQWFWDRSLEQDEDTMTRKMTTWLIKHFILLCHSLNTNKYETELQLRKGHPTSMKIPKDWWMHYDIRLYSRSSSPHWPVPGIHLLSELRGVCIHWQNWARLYWAAGAATLIQAWLWLVISNWLIWCINKKHGKMIHTYMSICTDVHVRKDFYSHALNTNGPVICDI